MPGEAPSPGYAPPPSAPPPTGQQYGTPQYQAPAPGGAYPPGAGYPPQGGYPPPGGYPPQGAYGPAPAGYATNDEKTWALIAHFGGIVVGFIAPLVAMLAKGNESPTVRAHSVEALNFQITWGIATIIASILAVCSFGILFFLPIATWIVIIVFSILGGMKANEGILYHYPMSIRMVK